MLCVLKLHHPWSLDSGSFLCCSSGSTPLLSFGFVLHMQTWKQTSTVGGHGGSTQPKTYVVYMWGEGPLFQFFLFGVSPHSWASRGPFPRNSVEERKKKEKIYLVLFALLWLSLFPKSCGQNEEVSLGILVCVSAVLFCELDQSWAVEF